VNINFVIRSLKLFAYYANELLAKFLDVHVQKINENIVQLMTGFDRITKDNEHLLGLHAVMVLSKRSSHDYDL